MCVKQSAGRTSLREKKGFLSDKAFPGIGVFSDVLRVPGQKNLMLLRSCCSFSFSCSEGPGPVLGLPGRMLALWEGTADPLLILTASHRWFLFGSLVVSQSSAHPEARAGE